MFAYMHCPQVTTNHFDIDSFLSVWCYCNRKLALQHEPGGQHAANQRNHGGAALNPSLNPQPSTQPLSDSNALGRPHPLPPTCHTVLTLRGAQPLPASVTTPFCKDTLSVCLSVSLPGHMSGMRRVQCCATWHASGTSARPTCPPSLWRSMGATTGCAPSATHVGGWRLAVGGCLSGRLAVSCCP